MNKLNKIIKKITKNKRLKTYFDIDINNNLYFYYQGRKIKIYSEDFDYLSTRRDNLYE